MGKRKRIEYQSVVDIDLEGLAEDADYHLGSLSARIKAEVETLQSLEMAIDEGESDADEAGIAALNAATATPCDVRKGCTSAMHCEMPQPSQGIMQPTGAPSASADADDHEGKEDDAIAGEHADEDRRGWSQVGVYVSDVPGDGQLRAQLRRARDRGRKKRKKDFSSFDLATVNGEVVEFLDDTSRAGGLELPNFSKMQRLQVRALAAVYGLEARACGRTGQTLFKTERTGPLTAEGCAQVQRLLACSIPSGKPTPELRRELEAAMRSSRAALSRPITADNKGSLMLKQMGWSEGSGLGAARQGRTEPVPLHLGQRRQGLGR